VSAEGWVAIATCLTTAAMAWFTWRLAVATVKMAHSTQATVEQTKIQTAVQTDQLRYYYEPSLWLQVDYDPQADAQRNGLPIKVWSGNQASLFSVEVRSKPEPAAWGNMKLLARNGDRAGVLPGLEPLDNWQCGCVRENDEWWLLLAGVTDLCDGQKLHVAWRYTGGDRWTQTWLLHRHGNSESPAQDKWSVTPEGKPKRDS